MLEIALVNSSVRVSLVMVVFIPVQCVQFVAYRTFFFFAKRIEKLR